MEYIRWRTQYLLSIRHKPVAAEVHLVPEELAKGKIKTSGWEVKYVWRF